VIIRGGEAGWEKGVWAMSGEAGEWSGGWV